MRGSPLHERPRKQGPSSCKVASGLYTGPRLLKIYRLRCPWLRTGLSRPSRGWLSHHLLSGLPGRLRVLIMTSPAQTCPSSSPPCHVFFMPVLSATWQWHSSAWRGLHLHHLHHPHALGCSRLHCLHGGHGFQAREITTLRNLSLSEGEALRLKYCPQPSALCVLIASSGCYILLIAQVQTRLQFDSGSFAAEPAGGLKAKTPKP